MRKAIVIASFAALLAGCATVDRTAVNEHVKQVQEYARLACSFVPTAATVARIFASGSGVDTAANVASAICTAVTNQPLAEGPGQRGAKVRGVAIKGRFVR